FLDNERLLTTAVMVPDWAPPGAFFVQDSRRFHLPGTDSRPAAILGRQRLRHRAAPRYRSRGRHVSSVYLSARDRPGKLEHSLRAALPPSDRQPLWRKPDAPAALLPVPGAA